MAPGDGTSGRGPALRAKARRADVASDVLGVRFARAMQRERQQAGALREARACQACAMQQGSTRNDDLGKVLQIFEYRRFARDVGDTGIAMQGSAELFLELFETIRCVADREPVAGLNPDGWQLRDEQTFAALDSIDAHLVVGQCQRFSERHSASDARVVDMKQRIEYAW